MNYLRLMYFGVFHYDYLVINIIILTIVTYFDESTNSSTKCFRMRFGLVPVKVERPPIFAAFTTLKVNAISAALASFACFFLDIS